MINNFKGILKNKEIRNKLLFTLAMLFVYRFGCKIVAPGINGIDKDALASLPILSMMNLLGGGALEQMSIFALGVGPYITASIIIQLLSMDVIPYLTELAKDGKNGRKQLDKITRYLAVAMALVQSYFIVRTLETSYSVIQDKTFAGYLYIAILFTAGTMFLLWIGDQISSKGIGNGTSMIIFAGIVADLPYTFQSVYKTAMANSGKGIALFIGYVIMYILIIALVTIMQLGERKIPIQYTSSSVMNKTKGDMNYLPLKINSASVIPVIFASALIQAPQIALSWINYSLYEKVAKFLDFSHPYILVFYAVVIVLFTFFYTNLEVDPTKIADNLRKQNTYVPGVRPGKETVDYVSTVLNRITVLGAIFLTFIAVLPYIVMQLTGLSHQAALGGTGIIIVVGIAIETHKQITSQLTQKSYRGFVGK